MPPIAPQILSLTLCPAALASDGPQPAKRAPTTGPLHLLLPLPEPFFPQGPAGLPLSPSPDLSSLVLLELSTTLQSHVCLCASSSPVYEFREGQWSVVLMLYPKASTLPGTQQVLKVMRSTSFMSPHPACICSEQGSGGRCPTPVKLSAQQGR